MTKYKYKVVVELQAGPDDTMVFDYTGVEYLTRQEAKSELLLAQCEVEHKNYILEAWIEKVEAE